jgi:hypothetical protein
MIAIVPPTIHHQLAEETFNQHVVDGRDVMPGRNSLRPGPITMAIRRGVAAIVRLFQRDQETVPDVAIVQPAGDEPVRLPIRADRDLAA